MITNIAVKSTFKSIKPFTWNGIPNLAIITGVNGVGKSQFLQILYDALGKVGHPNPDHRKNLPSHNIEFFADDDSYAPHTS